MSLTKGSGPFGERPAGTFNFRREGPERVLYWEPSPRRVRVVFAGETVADSRRAKLLHEEGLLPVYYFPAGDLRQDLLEPSSRRTRCPWKGDAAYWSVRVGDRVASDAVWGYDRPLDGAPPLAHHRAFRWDALDHWYEEDEEVFVHPRDPYSRIDVRASDRHVRVVVDGEVVAESRRPRVLFETGLPPRYYLRPEDVRTDRLERTDTRTGCAYKGFATYWSVQAEGGAIQDAVWGYEDPFHDGQPVRGCLCFDPRKVRVEVDGAPLPAA
ncbi:MAG: DUF427 domain-containing protein [Myxococcota bacterium]